MAADAEHSLVGLEEVRLAVGAVQPVARAAGHGGLGPWVPCLVSEGMADAVLVGVAVAAHLDRVFGEQERPLAPVGLVARRALEAAVGQMPALEARLRAAGVVASVFVHVLLTLQVLLGYVMLGALVTRLSILFQEA